jgi:AcrR family transcriptional regulator
MGKPPRRPGRPRSARLDDALLGAGLAVILEHGYHGATFTEIARRTATGTPAIYRRWPTKAALAIDIVEHVSEREPIPDTGSIRDDLVSFLTLRLQTWGTPLFRQLLLPLLLEGRTEGALATEVEERFLGYRRPLLARIRRSIEAGDLRADTKPGQLIDVLMGSVLMPMLFFQDLPALDEVGKIVDQVLSGFALRDPGHDHTPRQ